MPDLSGMSQLEYFGARGICGLAPIIETVRLQAAAASCAAPPHFWMDGLRKESSACHTCCPVPMQPESIRRKLPAHHFEFNVPQLTEQLEWDVVEEEEEEDEEWELDELLEEGDEERDEDTE